MKIRELYPDVITEDTSYEYKAVLNPDSPIKQAKTLIGYANDKGGTLFVGVSNDGEAFGINLEEELFEASFKKGNSSAKVNSTVPLKVH